ncbi:DUF4349 domain-containing protein [Streptomyces sp. NBC_01190]|uniref:DUF4349 domain-containing protein n=1 Tax=Streptomyces sp. NBC_01190 TaxID=2903767 RepID=UPI003863C5E5|nr:DUF4349 domain-containing protein [Streptomyces sp. NBC_01190]
MFAALLAAALTVAGCGSSGGGDSADSAAKGDRAPALSGPAAGGQNAAPDGKGAGSASGGAAADAGGGTPGSKTPTAPSASTSPSYLVRTAELTVSTPHVERQLDTARGYAVRAGGYAGDEDTTVDGAGHAESSVQLRVPATAYDQVLTELAGLGKLLNRSANVEDVTGQVVDVASRIKSQQASVARVRALMDRADRLSDVVTLESELSTRESALEALEAQQASLTSRTDLATITLRLTEPPVRPAPPKPAAHDGFWTSVGHALGDGWHAFYVTVRLLLIVLSVVLPFAAVALLGWFGYRLARRALWTPARGGGHLSLRAPDGRPRPAARSGRTPGESPASPDTPDSPGSPVDGPRQPSRAGAAEPVGEAGERGQGAERPGGPLGRDAGQESRDDR